MSKKKNEEQQPPIPPEPNALELIQKCGKLNYSIEQTASIVSSKCSEYTKSKLLQLLSSFESNEFQSYQEGIDIQLFDVESGLHDAAAGGDPDAQKALQNIQTEKIVKKTIQEKFFPEDTNI